MSIRFASNRLNYLRTAAAFLLACISLTLSASHTPDPSSVTVAGNLQDELGCPGDWQPDCAATQLGFDAEDGVWQGTFNIPAGNWEYKAPLNDSWDENYGANAQQNGANIPPGACRLGSRIQMETAFTTLRPTKFLRATTRPKL
jgi:hypothetical protein